MHASLPSRRLAFAVVLALAAAPASAASLTSSLKPGKADLKSAGPLAFGPEGILFVGDAKGASLFAFDTGDTRAGAAANIELSGLGEKIAGLLGTAPDQILVNDLAVNPISKNAYLSVSRGRGPDALPVIVKVDGKGQVSELSLDKLRFSSVPLPNPPADAPNARGVSPRLEAITDLAYLEGRLLVAGLSNEEFASTLRAVPFPFTAADKGSAVEIYHGSHGRFETNAPVRTFVPYTIGSQPHLLAAYTCTPLVKIPLGELKPGAKVKGTTIAELGNRNRPLDMVAYKKGGKDFILMNNSSRGVMKLAADKLESYAGITERTELGGVPFETVASLKGVEQLDAFGEAKALMLVRSEAGSLDLRTVDLP